MKTISMTEFNQRVSAVTREVVETGEPLRVTNRGRAVLRLVPEPVIADDPLAALIAEGLASPPRRKHRPARDRAPIELSHDLDELLAEVDGDVEI